VLGLVGGVLAIAGSGASSQGPKVVGGHSAAGSATPATPATSYGSPGASTASEGAGTTVHIKLYNADNHTVGVAMPVIAIFSHKITNARPFVQATRVTVNGKPYQAAWYFERSAAGLGAMEAHLRPEYYWPPHSKIHVSLDTQGKAAGRGLTYDDSLTLDFTTGAYQSYSGGVYTFASGGTFTISGAVVAAGINSVTNLLTGTFTITELAFGPGNTVTRLAATFTQNCEGGSPALRGRVVVAAEPWR